MCLLWFCPRNWRRKEETQHQETQHQETQHRHSSKGRGRRKRNSNCTHQHRGRALGRELLSIHRERHDSRAQLLSRRYLHGMGEMSKRQSYPPSHSRYTEYYAGMEPSPSLRKNPDGSRYTTQTRTSLQNNLSDVANSPPMPKPSQKQRSSRIRTRSPQDQHSASGDSLAVKSESSADSPHTAGSGSRLGAGGSPASPPQPAYHHHHYHHHHSTPPSSTPPSYTPASGLPPSSSFPEVYVCPRSVPHISFPVVDLSTRNHAPGAAALPRFSVAIVPKCATAEDLVTTLSPHGSGTRLKARLMRDSSAVDVLDDWGRPVQSQILSVDDIAELRCSIIQLEVVDGGERAEGPSHPAATTKIPERGGKKQSRPVSGQYRNPFVSDSPETPLKSGRKQ